MTTLMMSLKNLSVTYCLVGKWNDSLLFMCQIYTKKINSPDKFIKIFFFNPLFDLLNVIRMIFLDYVKNYFRK